MNPKTYSCRGGCLLQFGFLLALLSGLGTLPVSAAAEQRLARIQIGPHGRSFQTADGRPYAPFGVTYFRPGTGWAPQVWKQFDAEAIRRDFDRMKELGINCVRVFISYGSFQNEPDALSADGVAKFDQFLEIAEKAGIYLHPTGPDHWEGTPPWLSQDRIADEQALRSLETFWTLFAARYRDRTAIFAYDLRNEPEVGWDTPVLRQKWNRWLEQKYEAPQRMANAWGTSADGLQPGQIPVPEAKDAARNRLLLDYQSFREEIADEWTRRQVAAIKAADPKALVTVGLIQWSVPSMLARVSHYAGFHPQRQAQFLDFMEIHFYPLERGFYEYQSDQDEARNLAYLQTVLREVTLPGKPLVIAEFGWYGGGRLTIDQGKHPPASEEQQARWCRKLVERTAGTAVGWLNWGLYDHPQAGDVSQLIGLLTAEGRVKAWGSTFRRLARAEHPLGSGPTASPELPVLDWELCLTSAAEGNAYRERHFRAWSR